MKCPHCDKEITEEDKLIIFALRAACPDQHVGQMKYTLDGKDSHGFSGRGTFGVDGECRNFTIAFDQYRRLVTFSQQE